ncbi:MAG: adenine phosphoribosyltransferase [Dokdonella sp.]
MSESSNYFKSVIRTVIDWPQHGVRFRDITPLLQDPMAFRRLIDMLVERYRDARLDAIAAIDARGFIVGAPLAYALGCSFVPVRKRGKLPSATVSESYSLEYGEASIELHTDAFAPAARVLLVDDLIATGGSMLAAAKLVQRNGGELVEAAAVIDLPELGGSQRLHDAGIAAFAVCAFSELE